MWADAMVGVSAAMERHARRNAARGTAIGRLCAAPTCSCRHAVPTCRSPAPRDRRSAIEHSIRIRYTLSTEYVKLLIFLHDPPPESGASSYSRVSRTLRLSPSPPRRRSRRPGLSLSLSLGSRVSGLGLSRARRLAYKRERTLHRSRHRFFHKVFLFVSNRVTLSGVYCFVFSV